MHSCERPDHFVKHSRDLELFGYIYIYYIDRNPRNFSFLLAREKAKQDWTKLKKINQSNKETM